MDDDFGFGSSIWTTPSSDAYTANTERTSEIVLSPSHDAQFHDDAFDDFEFDAPIQASTSAVEDEDFGDFGDFGETIEGQGLDTFAQVSVFDNEGLFTAQNEAEWEALRLDPLPSGSSLKAGIGDVMQPLWDSISVSKLLTDEDIRQVGGLNQTLVTPGSRSLYTSLFQSPSPNLQPPNWTRSRIRRRHLVSLGIPVNLDEILPHANGKPLPALHITTRPLSAPPGPRALSRMSSPPPASTGGSRPASRSGTPKPSPLVQASSYAQLGLGPRPEINEPEINQMLGMGPDTLTLLPLPTLEAHLTRIRSLTASTSELLAHLLQQRDALQQDSETYNKLIAELVGEAQKMKSGPKTRNGRGRIASGMI
ncbi:hypothetical protein M0805_002448 [Coniferiporia weirii]|nr:hypothetical protein M0805_002448 [Coniferiporia weirii]